METHICIRKTFAHDSEYEDFAPIERRHSLACYSQIHLLVGHLMTFARAGRMGEQVAIQIEERLLSSFRNLRGDAFFLLRDHLIGMLVRDDAECRENEVHLQGPSNEENSNN